MRNCYRCKQRSGVNWVGFGDGLTEVESIRGVAARLPTSCAEAIVLIVNKLSPTGQGMLLMLCATLSFTSMQAGVRIVTADTVNPLDPLEVVFFRNLFGVIVLLPLLLRNGTGILRTHRLGLRFFRVLCQAVGMVYFFIALTLVPIAEITALSFSALLFAAVFAIVLLGERIRARRITALVVGVSGVVIALHPGQEALSLGALLVLGSSLSWAVAMAMIKSLS